MIHEATRRNTKKESLSSAFVSLGVASWIVEPFPWSRGQSSGWASVEGERTQARLQLDEDRSSSITKARTM
jgi:hypothetical protein